MDRSYYIPGEVAENYVGTACAKAAMSPVRQIILGIMAGAFIAFAAAGSNVAIHTIASVGIAKLVSGALFTAGLMMVIIAGAELFTGNCLMIVGCLEKKIKLRVMLRSWFFVYVGNFIGAMVVVLLIQASGQLDLSGGALGGFTIKIAAGKTSLSFLNAFTMGILCNWLVCVAVWMSSAANDIVGKIFAVFFPVWLFVTSGFEHSVANMYYIPAGILAKENAQWYQSAIALGATPEKIAHLSWQSFVLDNLLPVTLGNIVGGAVCVGCTYWFVYLAKGRSHGRHFAK